MFKTFINTYLLSFFFLFLSLPALQAQVEFTAKVSKDRLGINERLRIEFSANEDGDHFTPPGFEGFKVVMREKISVSNVWINGKRTFSKTFEYVLEPTAKGKFTIGSASIEIKGKTYKSNTVAITVTDAVKNPSINKTPEDVVDDNLFLTTEVSKTNPYLNEALTVTYKLYVGNQIGISGLNPIESPKFPDFWSQEISQQQRYEYEECEYQGKKYKCVVVKKVVLYPQKAGTLTLEPIVLDLGVVVPTGQRDFWGDAIVTQVQKRVTSGKKNIQVKPLPENGKPADFTGAVGNFSFAVNASKTTLKATEALQVKVEIAGSGNFKLFDIPKVSFPSALEVYDPEKSDNINVLTSGMRGHIHQNYTVVPQYKGKYPIPAVSFSYFNPQTQTYETIKSEELLIDVVEGANYNGNTTESTVNKQAVATQGNEFRFIQLNSGLHPKNQSYFFGSRNYYLWLFLPLLIIPIVLLFWKIKQSKDADLEGNKVKLANRLAKKYLGEAKRKLGEKNAFYEALERALHNYLKAKLKLETSELSKEKISELLSLRGVSQVTITEFLQLLKNCEMARYSPFDAVSMENDYQKSVQTLSTLDKQIKK
ncbi:BatD family protein [Capnocytophaga canimorsus]|uniref:BatD family protein n=1 Tax=Capnocytophaga canimorsus TaxID=28188 RepID=UPI00385E986C